MLNTAVTDLYLCKAMTCPCLTLAAGHSSALATSWHRISLLHSLPLQAALLQQRYNTLLIYISACQI